MTHHAQMRAAANPALTACGIILSVLRVFSTMEMSNGVACRVSMGWSGLYNEHRLDAEKGAICKRLALSQNHVVLVTKAGKGASSEESALWAANSYC